jgi:hypothetical protein
MKKITEDEVLSEIPEDFDPMTQVFSLSIEAKPINEDETCTDVKCKMHCTRDFAKSSIHSLLKDDEVLFSIIRDVMIDMMLENMTKDHVPVIMGKGGEA